MMPGRREASVPNMAAPEGDGEPPAVASQPPPRGSGLLDHFVRPFRRTSRYYARSWRDYLDREGDELPVARPTLALAAQAFRDEIVLTGFRMFRPVSDTHVFERINHEVRSALEFYGQKGYLDKPEEFFATPPPLTDVTVRPVKATGRSYERMVFDSGYEPRVGAPGRERWLGYTANNREYALLLRHPEPRPWLVCVHGAVMGRGLLDLTLFRAWHLHEDLGLNVVLPVLPMHGPRGRGLPRAQHSPARTCSMTSPPRLRRCGTFAVCCPGYACSNRTRQSVCTASPSVVTSHRWSPALRMV